MSQALALAVLMAASASVDAATGSLVCAGCHTDIYKRYVRTPMALSSGRVGAGDFQERFDRSEFTHSPSGIRYRVYRDSKNTRFDFDLTDQGARIHGSRRLEYFVGAGAAGRSYLFSIDGFLYQAPVSYYSSEHRWDLSPGYHGRDQLYLTRPVEAACLQCHASRLQPIAATLNGFAAAPFLEGGVGCERCHGSGEEHIARMKSGTIKGGNGIVNPRKLPADRRDDVCAQCHLSGVVRVDKAGRVPGSFEAGERLSDYVSVFVWSGVTPEFKVTSHYEKLAQSRCKMESGERLWCGTCHDPHAAPGDRTGRFRTKCLECHSAAATSCKETAAVRARLGNDCIACHMPKSPVVDVEHAVSTDHSIPRRAVSTGRLETSGAGVLMPFGGGTTSDRDLGMAYALVVENERNPEQEARAFALLRAAVATQPDDIPAVVQLALLHGYRSEEDQAIALYQRAVRADPKQVAAANNLATYLIKRGRGEEAMRLWAGALAANPGFEVARINLAVAQFRAGDVKAARDSLAKALELNPGSSDARRLLGQIR